MAVTFCFHCALSHGQATCTVVTVFQSFHPATSLPLLSSSRSVCLPTVLAPSGLHDHPNSTIQSLDLSPGRSKSNAKNADLILPHPLCYELAGGAVPIACTLCICSSSLPFWCTFSWCYLVTLLATGHPVGFCQAAS